VNCHTDDTVNRKRALNMYRSCSKNGTVVVGLTQ